MNADPGRELGEEVWEATKWGTGTCSIYFCLLHIAFHVFLPSFLLHETCASSLLAGLCLCQCLVLLALPFYPLSRALRWHEAKNSEISLSSIQNRLSSPRGGWRIWPMGIPMHDNPFEVNCLKAAAEVLRTVDDVPKQKLLPTLELTTHMIVLAIIKLIYIDLY